MNDGAHWIVTVVSAMIGAVVGYRLGVRIFANPQVEQTIKELKLVIKDLKKLKKNRNSVRQLDRMTIQAKADHSSIDKLNKASKEFLRKYGLIENG